jgi:hypothetical protein
MVVVTDYEFDVGAWRAAAGEGPEVVAVHLGTAGHRAAWERLPLSGRVRLHLDDEGPAGIRKIVLAGRAPGFSAGDVRFDFTDG